MMLTLLPLLKVCAEIRVNRCWATLQNSTLMCINHFYGKINFIYDLVIYSLQSISVHYKRLFTTAI